jgi:hypothetical protein
MVYTDRDLECSCLKLFLFGNILKKIFFFKKKKYFFKKKKIILSYQNNLKI